MAEKLLNPGSKVFFVDENCDLKLDTIIEFGFCLTNSEGVTFQLLKLQNGNVIRCCDVIDPEEAKFIETLYGIF
jgi:hypothetical protein